MADGSAGGANGGALPLISVVLPTHNRAPLLPRALESVFAQRGAFTLEVLVVDDFSTDATAQLMAGVDDERVRYIRNENNLGGSATRNAGLRAAQGEYVAFIDDDDIWLEHKLASQLALMSRFDACVCGFKTSRGQRVVLDLTQIRAEILGRIDTPPTSGFFGRTALFLELGFDESLPNGQDWDLLMRLAQRVEVGYVNAACFVLDDGDHTRISNAARTQGAEALERRLAAVNKHREALGPYWFNYRVARVLLTYFNDRPDKLSRLSATVRRCGVRPVARVLAKRAFATVKRKFDAVARRTPQRSTVALEREH